MTRKIKAAVDARRDRGFLIMARTDSRATEGLDQAIDRAKAYVQAGADMIFPEALESEREFEAFRKAIQVPLLANMTEFGKSRLLPAKTLEALGFNIVLYPVTTLRLALKAVEDGLDRILADGTQEPILDRMATRKRLYEILEYERYNSFDQNIFNFKL
jgi:methylisocitrate lyase